MTKTYTRRHLTFICGAESFAIGLDLTLSTSVRLARK